jgi:hypothetical protein
VQNSGFCHALRVDVVTNMVANKSNLSNEAHDLDAQSVQNSGFCHAQWVDMVTNMVVVQAPLAETHMCFATFVALKPLKVLVAF